MASLSKRIQAYLIDLIVIFIVLGFINVLYASNISSLNNQLSDLILSYFNRDITFSEYYSKSSFLYKEVDKENIYLNIINIFFIVVYFVLLPYKNNGKTIGKKMMHIQVKSSKSQKLTIINLLLRNFIINGLVYLIFVVIGCLIISGDIYFTYVSILGFIQIILMTISGVMVFYRKDRKGLHDLVSVTCVAESR